MGSLKGEERSSFHSNPLKLLRPLPLPSYPFCITFLHTSWLYTFLVQKNLSYPGGLGPEVVRNKTVSLKRIHSQALQTGVF